MPLFSKTNNIVGVDLGSTSIKVVELKKTKPLPKLVTYGYLDRAAGDIVRGNKEETKKRTAASLKKLFQRAGVTTNLAVTALPNFSIFSSIITLPVMPHKDLKEAIIEKSKKLIPIPLEEAVLDWKILEKFIPPNHQEAGREKKKSRENYRILINLAAKSLVKEYMEIFKEANLQLVSLETEAFALARALVGNDPSTVMIVDFSATSTDVIIIDKTIPIFNRSIDLGGVILTRTIAQAMNIDFQQAEQFKKDLNAAKITQIPAVIESDLKSILDEVKYSIDLFKNQIDKNIEKIILSGGSSYLSALTDYFSQQLNAKVIVVNPWKRTSYPDDLEPALIEVAPRFSVAIGLSLK